MSERMFPILKQGYSDRTSVTLGVPDEVPWSLLEPHRERAWKNHGQTLERLAERGGLDVSELLAVAGDRPWRRMSIDEQARDLSALLKGT